MKWFAVTCLMVILAAGLMVLGVCLDSQLLLATSSISLGGGLQAMLNAYQERSK